MMRQPWLLWKLHWQLQTGIRESFQDHDQVEDLYISIHT